MKLVRVVSSFLNWLSGFFGKSKKVNSDKKFVGSKRVPAGVIVWECDLSTGNIEKANVVDCSYVDRKGRRRIRREVALKKNCIYDYAINGENAVRKFEARILAYSQKV